MPIRYYKLEGKTPVAVESHINWNLWMAKATFAELTVMYNKFNDCLISTRFVGIDLNPGSCNSNSQPMVFESHVCTLDKRACLRKLKRSPLNNYGDIV